MSRTLLAVVPDDLAAWVHEMARGGGYRSISEVLRAGLRTLRQLSAPTATLGDVPATERMAAAVADVLRAARFPVVSTGSGGRQLTAQVSPTTSRLVDEMVADPSVPYQTHADVMRAALHAFTSACATLTAQDGENVGAWQATVRVAELEVERLRRIDTARLLERQSEHLYARLADAWDRADDDTGRDAYLEFYGLVQLLDPEFREWGEEVLTRLPLALRIGWVFRDVVPADLVPPVKPEVIGTDLMSDEGLYASRYTSERKRS